MILAMGLMLQAWVAAQEPDGVTVPPNGGVLDLYFIGKRQSQIEPCGCQTKQKGGIQYESSLYHKHPGRPVLKVDAGDWVRGRLDLVPLDALKTRYLLRAMHALGYDAINVGLNDVQNPPDFFESMREAHPGVLDALVSANIFLKSEPEKTYFPPWRIVERELEDGSKVRIGITGLTSINRNARESNQSLELGEYLLKDPVETLKAVVRELRPQVDVLVVLHTGIIPGELQLLVDAAPEVDFLVTTSNLANPAAMILRSGQTYMLSTPNNLGKEVGILSLKPGDEGRWQTAAMPTSLYVSLDLPVDEEMVALIEAFKQETR